MINIAYFMEFKEVGKNKSNCYNFFKHDIEMQIYTVTC